MSELPKGWRLAKLGDLAEYLNGAAFKPEDWGDEGMPIIRIQNLTDPGKSMNRTTRTIDERLRVRDGDILVSWSATLDAFIWDRGEAWLNQHIFRVLPKEHIVDKRFLFFLLRREIASLIETEHLHGSTMRHINRGPFLSHQVALPPLAEQRRIVAKLDALFARSRAARTELARVPRLAERAKQAVLAKAFSGELTREWKIVSVSEISEAVLDGPFGSNLKTEDYTSEGVRVIRLENIAHLNFVADKESFISFEKYEGLKRHTLQENDVLFSSFIDEEIRVCLYPGDLERPAINKADCFCIRVNEDRCRPHFLLYRLACRSTYEVLRETVHGATRPRINLSQLKKFSFDLPSLQEQAEIVRRIEAAFARIERMAGEAERAAALLERLEQATLAKAFRGELLAAAPLAEVVG